MYYLTRHAHTKDVDVWKGVLSVCGVSVHFVETIIGGPDIQIVAAMVFEEYSLSEKVGKITDLKAIEEFVIAEAPDYDTIIGLAAMEVL